MNNEIQIFNYEGFGDIRTVMMDNEPWFVGRDVARALGYTNSSKALADHVDAEDKLNNKSLSSLGQRGGWLINESGLYALIFGSKLRSARRFKRWVTSEVLPTLRKTGSYGNTPKDDDLLTILQFINNCHVDRLPYILSILRQKGYDVTIPERKKKQVDDRENRLPELLKDVSLTELSRKCGVARPVLWRYRTGYNRPYDDRYNMLVALLEQ